MTKFKKKTSEEESTLSMPQKKTQKPDFIMTTKLELELLVEQVLLCERPSTTGVGTWSKHEKLFDLFSSTMYAKFHQNRFNNVDFSI